MAKSPEFKALNERFLAIVNSTARIPGVTPAVIRNVGDAVMRALGGEPA